MAKKGMKRPEMNNSCSKDSYSNSTETHNQKDSAHESRSECCKKDSDR